MPPRKQSKNASTPKKRVAANGFKLPDPIPAGVVIIDVTKKSWVLGRSIGQGGFGEIYLASDTPGRSVTESDKYVVKVEPHNNGPLFTEMHCYMRIARPELIKEWMTLYKLKRLGMPKYLGSGSFEYNGQKYRFMVMERFGSDLQKILEQHNKKFSFKTVYQLGLEIIDVLEYIHDKGYIHADIKASNLLIGFQKGTENQVFLVDYGLACRFAVDGVHKEYKYDARKAHDGTIEFTSRDAHIGAHSRRGDLEILGYNMTQWLCGRLPWEDNLSDCDYVAKHKRWYMDNVDKFMEKCFPDGTPPGLREFLAYVASLTFDEKPDYEKCRNILRHGLIDRGYKDDGKLVFMAATPKPVSKKLKSRMKGVKRKRSEEEENIGLTPFKIIRTSPRSPCKSTTNRINTRLCPRKSFLGLSLSTVTLPQLPVFTDPEEELIEKENEKMLERQRNQRSARRLVIKKDTSLDNPTPQMLALMAKRRMKSMSPSFCSKKHKHKLNCVTSNTNGKTSPTFDEPYSELTPEMEAVIRRRAERQAEERRADLLAVETTSRSTSGRLGRGYSSGQSPVSAFSIVSSGRHPSRGFATSVTKKRTSRSCRENDEEAAIADSEITVGRLRVRSTDCSSNAAGNTPPCPRGLIRVQEVASLLEEAARAVAYRTPDTSQGYGISPSYGDPKERRVRDISQVRGSYAAGEESRERRVRDTSQDTESLVLEEPKNDGVRRARDTLHSRRSSLGSSQNREKRVLRRSARLTNLPAQVVEISLC